MVDNPVMALFSDSDLETISEWAADWLVDFHPQKMSTILVVRKQQLIFHPTPNG